MANARLGQLDGAEGTAESSDGATVASIDLRDTRRQETIEVRMPGGATGLKPGRITGFVASGLSRSVIQCFAATLSSMFSGNGARITASKWFLMTAPALVLALLEVL